MSNIDQPFINVYEMALRTAFGEPNLDLSFDLAPAAAGWLLPDAVVIWRRDILALEVYSRQASDSGCVQLRILPEMLLGVVSGKSLVQVIRMPVTNLSFFVHYQFFPPCRQYWVNYPPIYTEREVDVDYANNCVRVVKDEIHTVGYTHTRDAALQLFDLIAGQPVRVTLYVPEDSSPCVILRDRSVVLDSIEDAVRFIACLGSPKAVYYTPDLRTTTRVSAHWDGSSFIVETPDVGYTATLHTDTAAKIQSQSRQSSLLVQPKLPTRSQTVIESIGQ